MLNVLCFEHICVSVHFLSVHSNLMNQLDSTLWWPVSFTLSRLRRHCRSQQLFHNNIQSKQSGQTHRREIIHTMIHSHPLAISNKGLKQSRLSEWDSPTRRQNIIRHDSSSLCISYCQYLFRIAVPKALRG